MVVIGRRTVIIMLMVLLFLISFFSVRYLNRPRIRLGDQYITINYRAKINPKKNYKLKLWDYKWPGEEGDTWYLPYITTLIKDFEKANPNIQVELKLLDFKDGAGEFSKALASGNPPDVYCSAYEIPEFNYQWQIPADIFLKPQELNVYYPKLKKLLTKDKYLLTLPRWSAPRIWVGNRRLMEKAGLSVDNIQNKGWSWQELTEIKEKNEPYCISNFSLNGLLSQLISINQAKNNPSSVLDILDGLNRPLPQKIDFEANMIQLFLSGKVMFLAGVRPIIYGFIRKKVVASATGWEPVILPTPGERTGIINLPIESGVISIYRRLKIRGDDQIAAAARLGYFMSTYRHTEPWHRLKVIPGAPVLMDTYPQDKGTDNYLVRLAKWVAEGDLYSITSCSDYQMKVYPVLKEYLKGTASRKELEKVIVENY